MPTPQQNLSEPSSGRASPVLRISLKWLLFGFTFLGAGLGLLAKLLLQSPGTFLGVVAFLTTAVPFLLAIGTILRLGYQGQQRRLRAWGWLLFFMPIVGFAVLLIADRYIGSAPGGIGILSNTQLINQRLPQQIEAPWVWQELTLRRQSNSLSQSEVDRAVGKIIAHMKKTKPLGWNSPLHWGGKFLDDAQGAQLISGPVILDLCDAFYGTAPKIGRLTRLREGEATLEMSLSFGNPWSKNSGLPAHLLWTVSQVLVDGQPVNIERPRHFGENWNGNYRGAFDAGDHELTFEVECAYVDSNKLNSIRPGANESYLWPKQTRKTWKKTVKTNFKVFADADTLVKLATNPRDDPTATGAIQFERLVISPGRKNRKRGILFVRCSESLATQLSFDTTVTLGNQTFDLGSFLRVHQEDHLVSSGKKMRFRIDTLDSNATSAEVLLTPNPSHAEGIEGVKKIWGKPILFRKVPVVRLDLKPLVEDSAVDKETDTTEVD